MHMKRLIRNQLPDRTLPCKIKNAEEGRFGIFSTDFPYPQTADTLYKDMEAAGIEVVTTEVFQNDELPTRQLLRIKVQSPSNS